MSSYGYGVWLVIDQNYTSNHILHVTVQCNMTKDDAHKLYIDIFKKYGDTFHVDIKEDGIIFPTGMYDKDDNLQGWGYNIELIDCEWKSFQELSQKYKGSFSELPHLTIEYTNDGVQSHDKLHVIECILHVADINDRDPSKWFLIK